jgi:signal peptidase II
MNHRDLGQKAKATVDCNKSHPDVGEKAIDFKHKFQPTTCKREQDSTSLVWYRDKFLLPIVIVVLFFDQISKLFVVRWLPLYHSWPEQGFIRITHGFNTGTAFGFFPNQTTVLIIASLLAIGFLFYFYQTHLMPLKLLRLGIGLQLGGAAGNLIDRLRSGFVVDFIDVGPWPIFNLADSCIVVGITIIVVFTIFFRDKDIEPSKDASVR